MSADLEASVAHYNRLAGDYDRATRLINSVRQRTIKALSLKEGDVVLDAGCGTGYCLPMLRQAVGPAGQVIGIEPATAMLEIARHRVSQAGWNNVTLLHCEALLAHLPAIPNAALFSYTHDLIQSRRSLQHLFAQCHAGTRVASTSTKLYARWWVPGNLWLKWRHRGYITDFTGLDAPWTVLRESLDQFIVETGALTQHYIATGILSREYSRDAVHAADT